MAVHRVGKTLLIDELNAPLFFGEMVKVNRKDRLMVVVCRCVSLETILSSNHSLASSLSDG